MIYIFCCFVVFFFFKQKTAYEMRISDWSSDVCSSDLHRCLATLARDSVNHVVLEASSHGLHQYRLDGIRVSAAAFTNLTRDHLDYHGTMAAYLDAKLRLFRELLLPEGTAVVNVDDPAGAEVVADRKSTRLNYSP